jgi:hypothetical protein
LQSSFSVLAAAAAATTSAIDAPARPRVYAPVVEILPRVVV